MSILVRFLTVFYVIAWFPCSGRAAEISYKILQRGTAVYISGEIVEGDAAKFENLVRPFADSDTVVVLNSPGGLVSEGLAIGATIRVKGYKTLVADARCASTCGLIWLAGVKRYVGGTVSIGFHAAYTGSGYDAKESGVANAIVGAYLNMLGLSLDAIEYITSKGPYEMQWLQPEDGRKVGIDFTILPPKPENHPAPNVPLPDGSPLEHRAMNLVLSYYALWSGTTTDIDGLAPFYADSVNFYGGNVSRAKVLDEKRKFSMRWPIRTYSVRISTLFAQCTDVCSVSGVVEWNVSSVERNAHSIGAANFVVKIALKDSPPGGAILSENGSVLSSHADTLQPVQAPAQSQQSVMPPQISLSPQLSPEQQTSSATVAFAQGRQARIIYEQWYASLPDGPYRDGATFWAANRSLKVPPSCASLSDGRPEQYYWQQGCLEARSRLSPIDIRRKTEKDFWWGWNSL